jgi:hypothetical protein
VSRLPPLRRLVHAIARARPAAVFGNARAQVFAGGGQHGIGVRSGVSIRADDERVIVRDDSVHAIRAPLKAR